MIKLTKEAVLNWCALVLAAALFISPWAFGFDDVPAAAWTDRRPRNSDGQFCVLQHGTVKMDHDDCRDLYCHFSMGAWILGYPNCYGCSRHNRTYYYNNSRREVLVASYRLNRLRYAPRSTAGARRITELRDIPLQTELGLGDEEREDLSEIATIATLEIAPGHAGDGWRLIVTVEDEIGPRAPDDGSTVASDEEIDLDTFYKEYIRTGRGSANVVAEADDPEARGRMTRLLNAIERNQHVPQAARGN